MKCHAVEKQRVEVRKSEIVYNKMQMHVNVSKERENARDVRECEKSAFIIFHKFYLFVPFSLFLKTDTKLQSISKCSLSLQLAPL